jgi:hypothetical protein
MDKMNQESDDLKLTTRRAFTLVACSVGTVLAPPPLNVVAAILTGFFFLRQIRYIIKEVKGLL